MILSKYFKPEVNGGAGDASRCSHNELSTVFAREMAPKICVGTCKNECDRILSLVYSAIIAC